MKLSLPTKLISPFRRNISAVFWAALIIIVLLELWVIKGSVDIVLSTRKPLPASPSRQVRINFSVYEQILKRLQAAENYTPQPTTGSNPFVQPPKPVSGQ